MDFLIKIMSQNTIKKQSKALCWGGYWACRPVLFSVPSIYKNMELPKLETKNNLYYRRIFYVKEYFQHRN